MRRCFVYCGVYPRACGGTRDFRVSGRQIQGLSPRLRGNGSRYEKTVARVGSIPALAGERITVSDASGHEVVYPRACGGTLNHWRPQSLRRGLSPRLRGNVEMGLIFATSNGSIPALAGERATVPPLK